jgi:Restriction endonuclease
VESPKTLRRPANWQDFEMLCKKLWGEIWNCEEIQKNGRLGQDQSGVDIFGIPNLEVEYFGIQCKGKSEYNDNHPQFTEKEIDNEIEKAKSFRPKLKKLYFATTALNDSKIQTYIREKNIENKKINLFEVHLFCWETIVDLIDENKQTNDYYTKSQNYKSNKNAHITFQNDKNELEGNVKFCKTITNYRQRVVPASIADNILMNSNLINSLNVKPFSLYDYRINNSYYNFFLRIHNIGNDPIEDFKVVLKFNGDYQDLDTVSKAGNFLMSSVNYTYDTFINKENKTGKIIPLKKILVSEDNMGFDDIKIKPLPKDSEIIIDWKIISKDYKNEGKLILKLNAEIEIINKTILVIDPLEVRIEETEIEDYLTENK